VAFTKERKECEAVDQKMRERETESPEQLKEREVRAWYRKKKRYRHLEWKRREVQTSRAKEKRGANL
jgi:hypothetical protein